MQEVLQVVKSSHADFDAVCMATALHKMGSLDADALHYRLLEDSQELTRLKDIICELRRFGKPTMQLTCSAFIHAIGAACALA